MVADTEKREAVGLTEYVDRKNKEKSLVENAGLANLALQEQGSIDGTFAELSLMANLFEQQSK